MNFVYASLIYDHIDYSSTNNKQNKKGRNLLYRQYVAENLIYKLLYQNYIIEAIKTN